MPAASGQLFCAAVRSGGSAGSWRVGLCPSQPRLAGRLRLRGKLRPGRTALRLLVINLSTLAKPCTQGRTSKSTKVFLRRDTPWVKFTFQRSLRALWRCSMTGCSRCCINSARFFRNNRDRPRIQSALDVYFGCPIDYSCRWVGLGKPCCCLHQLLPLPRIRPPKP